MIDFWILGGCLGFTMDFLDLRLVFWIHEGFVDYRLFFLVSRSIHNWFSRISTSGYVGTDLGTKLRVVFQMVCVMPCQ